MPIIKQPPMYFDYANPSWVKPYNHTLVLCECGNLCEKGIGLCDKCVDQVSLKNEKALEEMLSAWSEHPERKPK